MPVTIATLDDFIAAHGGNAVMAVDLDGSWTGQPPGTPVANGGMYLLPDGSWYRTDDNGNTSWQVPLGDDKPKWVIAYLQSRLWHLQQKGQEIQRWLWDRLHSTGQEMTKAEEKEWKRLKAEVRAIRAKLEPAPSARPVPTAEEMKREEKKRQAAERMAALLGEPPSEAEVKEIRMSLEEGFALQRMGVNIRVSPTRDGKGIATVKLSDNA